jgi:CDP-paratose 2-epimerase
VLVTGGAGFIGTNLADHLLRSGRPVLLLDNLSRPGVEDNLRYLKAEHGDLVEIEAGDVRDRTAVRRVVRRAGAVFHLAAQVAVTTSLSDPREDFEINARGTLNLLEEIRAVATPPPLVYTSTNKVYGALADLRVVERDGAWEPVDEHVRRSGIGATRPLDFYSPYGCSKGAADQYVLDYARSFRLPAVVFRMSCIYGPHQCGNEDQGWVAHFLISALAGRRIAIYGDGKQVRDVLHADDLVAALLLASGHAATLAGRAFNIGGGPGNALSLLRLLSMIETLHGERPPVTHGPWRVGDQKYYVSDTSAFTAATGWQPRIAAVDGIARLYHWLLAARGAAAPPTAEAVRAGRGS